MLYKGMTLIDGSGAAPRPDMALILEGERIAMVFPAKQLEIMKLARMEVIDAVGLTALPGPLAAEEAEARVRSGEPLKKAVIAALGGRCIRGGVLADLVFLKGDPLVDAAALRRVAFTVQRGVRSGA